MARNTTRPSLKPYGVHPIHDILTTAASKYPDKTAITSLMFHVEDKIIHGAGG